MTLISNTIFTTICLLLFLLPGFIIIRTFLGSDKGSVRASNIYSYITWGTPLSLTMYAIGFIFVRLFNKDAFLTHVKKPLLQCWEICAVTAKSDPIQPTFNWADLIFLYVFCFVLYSFSFLIPLLYKFFYYKLRFYSNEDFRFEDLLYHNLSGNAERVREAARKRLNSPTDPPRYNNYDFKTRIDLICVLGGLVRVYRGYLEDFQLSNGALNCIFLTDVKRLDIYPLEGSIRLDRPTSTTVAGDQQATGNQQSAIQPSPLLELTDISESENMYFKGEEIKNINFFYEPA